MPLKNELTFPATLAATVLAVFSRAGATTCLSWLTCSLGDQVVPLFLFSVIRILGLVSFVSTLATRFVGILPFGREPDPVPDPDPDTGRVEEPDPDSSTFLELVVGDVSGTGFAAF